MHPCTRYALVLTVAHDRAHTRVSVSCRYGHERTFPAVAFTALARRRPMYHILHLLLPMSLFSFLSLAQMVVTAKDGLYHRTQMTLVRACVPARQHPALPCRLGAV